ncbi:hypothetical protein OAS07_06260 [Candidatus Thioglobus sp.]|nr:hypothetical protein [Candidatus Thioglobus sp.]
MDINIVNKIVLFWVIFFITPGPVWLSVMEVTRNLSFAKIWNFFFKTFLPVNLSIQVPQAIICVIFVEYILNIFSNVGFWLYILSGLYIIYLAFKVINSKRLNINSQLSFVNLAMVMLLSPKIWLLFPSGAVIAIQLQQGMLINSALFASSMLIISFLMFFLYVVIGKIGAKLLKDNFTYLTFVLLILFALFLFFEAIGFTN